MPVREGDSANLIASRGSRGLWFALVMCVLIAPVAAQGAYRRPAGASTNAIDACTGSNATLEMPASVSGIPGELKDVPLFGNVPAGTLAVNATIQWNPSVLAGVTVTKAPGLPADWALDFGLTPGQVAISLYGITPVGGGQTLVSIRFTVVGAIGTSSALDLTFGEVNEVPACLIDVTFYICPFCDDGNACTSDSCVAGQCVFAPLSAGVVCRAATNVCDVAETCDGLGGQCPADLPAPRPPEINTTVRVDKTPANATISWIDPPGPYNIYRGTRAANAAFAYNHACKSAHVVGNALNDSDTPLPNQLFYYLVSRVNACSESSLGAGSSGAERPNTSSCGLSAR